MKSFTKLFGFVPIFVLYISLLDVIQVCYSGGWSAYTCVGQPAWDATPDDNVEATKTIQNWFAFRQSRCVNESSPVYWTRTQVYGGLGSHLTASVTDFLKATEVGHIYAPGPGYVWGFHNDTDCSRHIKSVDCFNLPLTLCTPDAPLPSYPAGVDVEKAIAFHDGASDICVITKKLRKTILWTMGQVYIYHTRLPPKLHKEFTDEVNLIMKLLHSAKPKHSKNNTCVTTSIHVRTGHLDFGRRPFDGSEHIEQLRLHNEELLKQNKEICGVFVACSDPNTTIFKDVVFGKLTPLHGFDILLMPRFIGNTSLEMEQQIWYLAAVPPFRPDRLYIEYLIDMRVFGETDIFLGSHSNMFLYAVALRQALHPSYRGDQTCFLDSRHPGAPLSCLGSMGVLKFMRDAVQGFNGGAMYFVG